MKAQFFARLAALFLAVLLSVTLWLPSRADEKPLLVFAAISMKAALEPIIADFEKETGRKVTLSVAGSSILARQIAAGAPADVFVSADIDWASWLKTQNLTVPESQRIVARNQLALVVPKDVPISGDQNIADVLNGWLAEKGSRIAVANPDHIPAGRYARATLKKMEAEIGPYKAIEKRMAITGNVRLASVLVGRAEVPLGIVYHSEAVINPDIKLVGLFSSDSHPDIVYPALRLLNGRSDADTFLDYLESKLAKMHFVKAGLFVPK
ncbi:MAG: molybdate ABC transporter substrate-binding protein [Hyphomicrobiales bacterium]